MNVMGLCIKVDSYVAHMSYVWSFIHNTEVLISIKKNKDFLSFNINTTVIAGWYSNYKKNKTQ